MSLMMSFQRREYAKGLLTERVQGWVVSDSAAHGGDLATANYYDLPTTLNMHVLRVPALEIKD